MTSRRAPPDARIVRSRRSDFAASSVNRARPPGRRTRRRSRAGRRSRWCRRPASTPAATRRVPGSSPPPSRRPARPPAAGAGSRRGRRGRPGGRCAGRSSRPSAAPRVGRLEHLGVLDAHRRQRGDVEEPPVVQLRVAAPPVDQPVVLAVVHVRRRAAAGAGRDRERGRSRPAVAVDASARRRRPRRRAPAAAAGPRDQSMSNYGGVLGLPAVAQHVPPPRLASAPRPTCGWARCRRPSPGPARAAGRQRLAPASPPSSGRARRRVDDVVAVRGTGRGLQHRRRVQRADAEPAQVAGDARRPGEA